MKKPAQPTSSTPTDACKSVSHKNGFVLIEVMIAMSIGLIIIGLLMELYLASQNTLKLETALSSIQGQAQAFTSLLSEEIHKSGNIGCARLTQDFPIISLPEYPFNSANKITSASPGELTLRYADYPVATLTQTMQDNMRIYLSNNIHIKPGDILLIANCQRAEMFIVKNVTRRNSMLEITSTSSLHDRYEKNSEVSKLHINKFYLAKTTRKNSDESVIYALFVEDIHHRKSELIAGVKQIQVKLEPKGVAIDFELHAPPVRKMWHMYVGSGVIPP